jgi:hypothetical protein
MNLRHSIAAAWLLALIVVLSGCRKHNFYPNVAAYLAGYRIKLVSGGGQSDTTGNILSKELVFSLYVNGQPPTSGYVKFQTVDCDGNFQSTEYPLSTIQAPLDSLEAFQWQLNATVGIQTLTAYFLDSTNAVKDSDMVTATGLAPGPGWHTSGCILAGYGNMFGTFAELPSGRVLGASLKNADYPFYSDDDGISWHRLMTFPGRYVITKLVTTPQNEILASVIRTGVYYSKDGGQTWTLRGTAASGLPLSGFDGDLELTQTGQVFTFTNVGTYYSRDMAQTWSLAQGLEVVGFNGASSTTGGILFGVAGGAVYRSNDSGAYWNDIWTADNYGSYLILADGASNLYIGGSNGMYASKDTGATWTQVYPVISGGPDADNSVYYLMKVGNGFYFYAYGTNSLEQTTDFVNFSTLQLPVQLEGQAGGGLADLLIVTQNGHYICSEDPNGVVYYNP